MTLTATSPDVTTVPIELTPAIRPTDADMVASIIHEADCTTRQAEGLMDFLKEAVSQIRASAYQGMYHLDDDDLSQYHDLFAKVIPDDVKAPAPGSAHDTLNRGLLRGDELSIVHSQSGDVVMNCTVALDLQTAG